MSDNDGAVQRCLYIPCPHYLVVVLIYLQTSCTVCLHHDNAVSQALEGSLGEGETDWQGGRTLQESRRQKTEVWRREKMQSRQFCSLGLFSSGLRINRKTYQGCKRQNTVLVCTTFGHGPGAVEVTSVKEKKKYHLHLEQLCASHTCVPRVSSVSLSVCLVSPHMF